MDSTVKVAAGHLRGTQVDTVHAFLGVPFAAPPVGPHRLRQPQPVEPWSGVREATEIGPAPPQVAPPEGGGSGWDSGAIGEDCLTLNVWTPDPGAAGLPVMVWVQGGMFEIGATAAYDGRHFARDGVVCVVINWRLGADGFLYLDDGVANLGLLDQLAALEWVRDNIAGFGGDPDNVTVFGESAGAMSIGVMLAMPAARGLFRRVVLQSGAAHHAITADTAVRIGRSLADRLGVPPRRDEIAALPVERLLLAQAELKAELLAHPDPDRWGGDLPASMMLWQPVIDGRTLPGTPIEQIAGGSAGQVDVLAGTNTDDWRLFLAITGELARITEEMLTGPVAVHGFRTLAAYGLPVEQGLAAYRTRHPNAAPGELLAAVQTDWWTRVPAIRLAEAHVNQRSGTYMYEFAWPAPGLGAVHALEIPFVFDILGADAVLFGPLVGDTAPQELADTMHRAWISFAARGDPGWPPYGPDRRATMRFDTESLIVDDPRAWERDFWHGIR